MKPSVIKATVFAVLALTTATVVTAFIPTRKLADRLEKLVVDEAVPLEFGDWKSDPTAISGVVNPQQKEKLDKLYTQVLSRSYINTRTGYRIMLSIAYGEDQRDANQLHYPEICYPSQGFQVESNVIGVLHTKLGDIPVRRLETSMSQQRYEPVTYWTTVGTQALTGGTKKKLAEMKYNIQGEIPDGLLFRVSSIDRNSEQAFAQQTRFVDELLPAIRPSARLRLSGLN